MAGRRGASGGGRRGSGSTRRPTKMAGGGSLSKGADGVKRSSQKGIAFTNALKKGIDHAKKELNIG